ncbi:alcohol dehydrogenase catalytic domain-containing protein [Mesorhizobium sp. ORM8.1]
MRGISFPGGREIKYTTVEDPTPGPDEVVIEIKASGMCGSDLHDYRADASSPNVRPDLIRGHEPAGIVVATGSNANKRLWRDGARVMVHHYYGCTTCNQCRSGWPQLCTDGDMQLYGSNAHGCHAPYMKVPAATLVLLDEPLFRVRSRYQLRNGNGMGRLEQAWRHGT